MQSRPLQAGGAKRLVRFDKKVHLQNVAPHECEDRAGSNLDGRRALVASCVMPSNQNNAIVAGVDYLFDFDRIAVEGFGEGTRELHVPVASDETADTRQSRACSPTSSPDQARHDQSLGDGLIECSAPVAAPHALLEDVERSPDDLDVLPQYRPFCLEPLAPQS